MAVPEFNVKEQWIGTSQLTDYTFDFTIQDLKHLLLIIQDSFGNEVARVRGDDTTILASVIFDSKNGGGTISLKNELAIKYVLTALQANDAPTQPAEFKDKNSFTLELFELAMDYIITGVQRLAYLAQRSAKLHDLDDIDTFDVTLPRAMSANPRATIVINGAGTGFDLGPTVDVILEAEDFAAQSAASAQAAAADVVLADQAVVAANVSVTAAAASATAAAISAAQAAASAGLQAHTGPFTSIAPNTNSNLLGETTDSTKNRMVEYIVRIVRGTTVYARQQFIIFYRNGAWEIAIGQDLYADAGSDHGVTFTVNSVTAQINAAVANDGGSNAVIDIIKTNWPN